MPIKFMSVEKNKSINPIPLVVLISGALLSTSANAGGGYLDYRHEYLSTQRVHYDRAKMGYFLDSGFDVHLEIMWKQKNDLDKTPHKNNSGVVTKPKNRDRWGHFEENGHGIIINYPLRFNTLKDWTFTPTFSVYSSSYWTTYEPGLEVGYKLSQENRIRARFRVDLDHPSSNNSADKQKTYRTDFWYDWRPTSLPIGITYNFVWYDTENIRWNNKTYDYAQELKLQYKYDKNWTPYVAIGDVKGPDKFDDNRQIRWRAGLSYNF